MRCVVNTKRQHGAQVVEYALLISVVSISLVLGLPRLSNGICGVNNRVGELLGAASFSCAADSGSGNGGSGNNGGGNNTGNGNNGGGNNNGSGTNGGGNNNGGGNGPGGGNGRP